MATKDITSSILKRLEEGTAEIYSRYRNLIENSKLSYQSKIKSLDQEYRAAANDASARAKIDLKNTMEKMADSGYVRSGETVHATLSANANRAAALSDLAVQKAKDVAALERESADREAQMADQAQKEAAQFEERMLESARDQENRDREYQAMLEQQKQETAAKQEQQTFENRLALEKLNLEKAKQAAQSAAGKSSGSQEEGIRPAITAYDYLDQIVARNTKRSENGNYKVIDRKGILKAVTMIIKDANLSRQYRYELYLYAKSMGYVSES